MRGRFFAISLSALLILGSCTGGPRLIPKREFARIYADMFRADKWIEDHHELREQADTTLVYEAVFRQHGYTSDDYLYSVGKYLADPEEYSRILKQTAAILDARIEELVSQRDLEESVSDVPERPDRRDRHGRPEPIEIDEEL